jgi:ABC-type uncharacterized transport system auxiliary subunit
MMTWTPERSSHLLLALALLCASGCALLGKGKPLSVRYFDLEADTSYRPSVQVASPRLRLGSVSAARYIDRRFVSRRSAHELSYHDGWRFSDQPEAFLERALSENLFERAGLTRVVSGLSPTLEVKLTAFEENALSGAHKAHVSVLAVVHDDRVQLWQRSFEVTREVGAGDEAEALAGALGKALAEVAVQVTEETLRTLARPAAPAQAE